MIGKLCADAGKNRASAHIVDGRLILSLPRAERPIVWQMDLAQTKSSALEVRQSEDGSRHILVLKTPRGETVEIAPFVEKADAVEGLMAVTGAFENAHGRIRQIATNDGGAPAQEFHAPIHKKHHGKWLALVLGLALVIVLMVLWSSPTTDSVGTGTSPADGASQTGAGVPVPADTFLQNR